MAGYLYSRMLVKISGEALASDAGFGINPTVLDRLANDVAEVARKGIEIGLVIGGGNLFSWC